MPRNWDVTSDSLAAWLAARLGARLLLVKRMRPAPGATLHGLALAGLVDRAFPLRRRGIGRRVDRGTGRPARACSIPTRRRGLRWRRSRRPPDPVAKPRDAALGLGADRIGAFLHRMPRPDPHPRPRRSVRQPRRGRSGADVQARSSTCRKGRASSATRRRRPHPWGCSITASITRWCWHRRPRTRSRNACSASRTRSRPTCSRRPASAACR